MLGNKHITITGSLFFDSDPNAWPSSYASMVNYFMESQEDKKREYVAGYQVNSDGTILIRYGKIDIVYL
jgi:hypothetical protein